MYVCTYMYESKDLITLMFACKFEGHFKLNNGRIWFITYDIFVSCNWVDIRWQQQSTHLHTNSTQNKTLKQNTQNETHITVSTHKYNNQNTYRNNKNT